MTIKEVDDFLKDNLSLINSKKIDELYRNANNQLSVDIISYIAICLINEYRIDPLEYVNEIYPWMYRWRDFNSFTIPNSITKIGVGAFWGCSNLQSITIPNSVTKIEDDAFYDCSSLLSIEVELGNPKYDSRQNCNAIIETATNKIIRGCNNTIIPDGITEICGWAFDGCASLQNIEIPNSVTEIGDYAFSDCSCLQSIKIPNSVTNIGEFAFWGCSNLQSITIPNSVTKIGEFAFEGCFSLQNIAILKKHNNPK